jgi:hypothetical protein
LVSLESIGTDPALASTNFAYPQLLDWYNNSWFSKAPFAAKLVAKNGYIAPPLTAFGQQHHTYTMALYQHWKSF